ncbi:unnamed protein product, partial [Ectocarpus sp. 12 AP-2014]
LRDCEAVVYCPSELGMGDADAEVNHLVTTQTGSLLAVYYDPTTEENNEFAARMAEFDVSAEDLTAGPTLKAFEDPDLDGKIFPSFDTPKSVKFRSHVALATLEGEHVMVVSHNSLDGTPSVLTTKTGAGAGDNGRWSSYELPDGFDWDLGGVFSRGLCFSECCDTPVPAQTKKGATDYGAGP